MDIYGKAQISNFLRVGDSKIITTGYKKLDYLFGGGFVEGSTNLFVEDRFCRGNIFLLSLLRRRVESGDFGVVDCFSEQPRMLKRIAEIRGVNLEANNGKIYLLDLSSQNKIKSKFGLTDGTLSGFAEKYEGYKRKLFNHSIVL